MHNFLHFILQGWIGVLGQCIVELLLFLALQLRIIRKRWMDIRERLPAILRGVQFLPDVCFIRKVQASIYRARPACIDAVDLCLGKLEDTHKQLLKDLFLPNLLKLRLDKTKHPPLLLNDLADSRLPDEKYLVGVDILVALCKVLGNLHGPRHVNESTMKVKNNVILMRICREGLEEVIQVVFRGVIEGAIF